MKKALLLFAALLVAGCGEKSSSEGSESASGNPTPSNESADTSADTAKPPPADPPVAESPSEEPSESPNSLNYAEAERLLKDAVHVDAVGQLLEQAVDLSSLRWVDGLHYQTNESEPFSGWIKQMYASGQVEALSHTDGFLTSWHENGQKQSEATYKDGEVDGLETWWDENGQKEQESTYKDGKEDGLWTYWHENGQRKSETTFKDGKELSAKYWNSKGEEITQSPDRGAVAGSYLLVNTVNPTKDYDTMMVGYKDATSTSLKNDDIDNDTNPAEYGTPQVFGTYGDANYQSKYHFEMSALDVNVSDVPVGGCFRVIVTGYPDRQVPRLDTIPYDQVQGARPSATYLDGLRLNIGVIAVGQNTTQLDVDPARLTHQIELAADQIRDYTIVDIKLNSDKTAVSEIQINGTTWTALASADTAKPPPAETPVAESPSEEPSDTPNSLSDADVERLLKEAVEFDSLQERGDLRHQVNESEPYSGWAKGMYDSGQVEALVQFKDGKMDGLHTWWHENGQKMGEGTAKDGKPDGLYMLWHENGQKKQESTYKDGKEDGLRTQWHENGQKEDETTFKDGKEDGLRTKWHENGQKWLEKTFKDGAWLGGSEKYWNSKGEEVETRKEAQGSDSTGENPSAPNQTEEPSADTAKPPPVEPPVPESPSEEPSDTPNTLSDADVERLLKEAVEEESLQYRDGLFYQNNEPYSGWAKGMHDSGQVESLMEFRDGKKEHHRTWQENGQKKSENTWKDGESDGLQTFWHENGQKWTEQTYKDGRWVSAKYWNSKGEEVETYQESQK